MTAGASPSSSCEGRPMLRLTLVAIVLFGVVARDGTAQPQPKPRSAAARPTLEEWTLGNGLQVVTVAVHRRPVVTVQLWVHAGSKDEPRDRRGSAHMFEHLMFKGSEHVPPEEHARLVDRVGGLSNAFTREDVTAYDDT